MADLESTRRMDKALKCNVGIDCPNYIQLLYTKDFTFFLFALESTTENHPFMHFMSLEVVTVTNIMSVLLKRTQHSWDPSCTDLGHVQLFMNNGPNCSC
jgi:hypothetical protein